MAITNDRFGNPQAVIGLKDKKGTGYSKGFVEIKGDLYKVTTSPSNKEGVSEWVTLTKMKKQPSGPFGMMRNQGNAVFGPNNRTF